MLSDTEIATITNKIEAIPGLACAYLHGSALTDYFRPDSDIDIALLFMPGNNGHCMEELLDCCAAIESDTGHPVHFSRLSSYHTVFSKEVTTKGRLILCNDPYVCKSFSMHILSMYINLSQERREVLEQYVA